MSYSLSTRQATLTVSTGPAPPITTLLSQYELLKSLSAHLSSADIIHLGATSKEHWQYVAASPVILKALLEESTCDGKGITAQAHVFGHWKGDPTKATRTCKGKLASPCLDCGAMVCNACRFHVVYPEKDWLDESDDMSDESDDMSDDMRFTEEEWDDHEDSLCLRIETGLLKTNSIEAIKAQEIFAENSWQTFCSDCEPICLQLEEPVTFCRCNLYSCFVESWRCIPCVIAEQAKAVSQRQPFKVRYISRYANQPALRMCLYERDPLCACGKPDGPQTISTCRKCGKCVGTYGDKPVVGLKRLHAQLGTSIDNRAGDPILSQLG